MKNRLISLLIMLIMIVSTFSAIIVTASAATTLQISQPQNNQWISYSNPPRLTWTKVDGAEGYRVSIRNLETDTPIVVNKWTTNTYFDLDGKLDRAASEYRIWVGAMYSKSDAGVDAFTASDIIIHTEPEAPEIEDETWEETTHESVVLSMEITKDNGAAITDSGFYIVESGLPTSESIQYSFSKNGAFSATTKGYKELTITGLKPNTKYYFWAYAVNDIGETRTSRHAVTTDKYDCPHTMGLYTNTYPESVKYLNISDAEQHEEVWYFHQYCNYCDEVVKENSITEIFYNDHEFINDVCKLCNMEAIDEYICPHTMGLYTKTSPDNVKYLNIDDAEQHEEVWYFHQYCNYCDEVVKENSVTETFYYDHEFANNVCKLCYYEKPVGPKFSKGPTLSVSIDGYSINGNIYGEYLPGDTITLQCTANYSDHIFVQTSSNDLVFTNIDGFTGKSGTFIEATSASKSKIRSYTNGRQMQIVINISEEIEPGDYKISMTASDGVYDPDTFSSIEGTSFYPSETKSVIVRIGSKTNHTVGSKNFSSFSEAEKMIRYSYASTWSEIGIINYVEQYWPGGNDKYYYTDDNAKENNRSGGYWTDNSEANGRCTRAAASMALSYMGITAFPKNFNPTNSPYKNYAASLGCTTIGNDLETLGSAYSISLSEFEAWYEKYENDTTGMYSPIILHTYYANGGIHAFTVFGRDINNKNYYYVVDSGTGDHIAKIKIVEKNGVIRIDEYKYADGTIVTKYNSSYKMVGVWQYTKENTSVDIPTVGSGTYNATNAVAYAKKWTVKSNVVNSKGGPCNYGHNTVCTGYHPDYYNPEYNSGYVNNDCANFVSQCLLYGGLQTNSEWEKGSDAWIGSKSLLAYLKNQHYDYFPAGEFTTADIEVGDLIWTNNFGHVMIVSGECVGNQVVYCGHTNDRLDSKISYSELNGLVKIQHTHTYNAINHNPAHPHEEYAECVCRDTMYTGKTIKIPECSECNSTDGFTWNNPFTDITPTNTYYDAIKYVYQNNLMIGSSETTFEPNKILTRAMIVTILGRLNDIGKPDSSHIATIFPGNTTFHDVISGEWYAPYVEWGHKIEVVKGYNDTTFGPNDKVTIEEAVVFLYRYAGISAFSGTDKSSISNYTDYASVSNWATDAMIWAIDEGIYVPVSNDLNPKDPASRAVVATMVYNYCKSVEGR